MLRRDVASPRRRIRFGTHRQADSAKSEVAELSKTHDEEAQSIAGFTQVSAHEATRDEPNPALLKHSLDGLAASVEGFEQSNPRLVDIVNRICTTLSNLGI